MFPIGDDNDTQRGTAWLTFGLIAVNVLVFVFVQGFGRNDGVIASLAAVPAEILSGKDLASEARRVLDPYSGRTYLLPGLAVTPIPVLLTILSSLFLHGSLGHLVGNMLFLGIFGDNVESRIGRVRFLFLYIVAGIAGALTQVAVSAMSGSGLYSPMVGASGAISGIMGAYLVLFPGNRIYVLLLGFIPTALSAWLVIGAWFLMQLGGGLAGPTSGGVAIGKVAYAAHIGGFLLAWLWARVYKRKEAKILEKLKAERLRSGSADGVAWTILD